MHGATRCHYGFVAMRLEWPGGASTATTHKTLISGRTCVDAKGAPASSSESEHEDKYVFEEDTTQFVSGLLNFKRVSYNFLTANRCIAC